MSDHTSNHIVVLYIVFCILLGLPDAGATDFRGLSAKAADDSLEQATGAFILIPRKTSFDPTSKIQSIKEVEDLENRHGVKIGMGLNSPFLMQENVQASFNPASLVKIFTSAVSLRTLGKDYQFETRVTWRENLEARSITDLTFIGSGDPTFGHNAFDKYGHQRFREWAAGLRKRGLRKVYGEIKLVSNFDRRLNQPSRNDLTSLDRMACYSAEANIFNFKGNCSTLVIEGLNKAHWSSPFLKFPLRFKMEYGEETKVKIDAKTDANGRTQYFLIYGTWKRPPTPSPTPPPQDKVLSSEQSKPEKDAVYVSLAIENTHQWFKDVAMYELRRAGISWKQKHSLNLNDSSFAENEHIWYSPKLSVILKKVVKHSDNFLADALYKHALQVLSFNYPQLTTYPQLMNQMIDQWAEEIEFENLGENLNIVDGSGLSPKNKVTTEILLKFLEYFTYQNYFYSLYDSLPIAGVDGTLSSRMKNSVVEGLVRAKTGTRNGQYQLSGYIPQLTTDGKVIQLIPFAILTQTTKQNRWRVHQFQDHMVQQLFQKINN